MPFRKRLNAMRYIRDILLSKMWSWHSITRLNKYIHSSDRWHLLERNFLDKKQLCLLKFHRLFGGRLNIKMSSYQYIPILKMRRSLILIMEIPYLKRRVLLWNGTQIALWVPIDSSRNNREAVVWIITLEKHCVNDDISSKLIHGLWRMYVSVS